MKNEKKYSHIHKNPVREVHLTVEAREVTKFTGFTQQDDRRSAQPPSPQVFTGLSFPLLKESTDA